MEDKVTLHNKAIYTAVATALDIPKDNVKYKEIEDYQLKIMTRYLEIALWGESLAVREYPATWWDAFNLRWYPKWLLKKLPVNMSKLEVMAFYPQMSFPEQRHNIKILKTPNNKQWMEEETRESTRYRDARYEHHGSTTI